jgi:sec-independent protein translocase protein TatA
VSVGPAEIIIVLVIALLVFGPKRLPQMGKSLGKGVREFRKAAETAKTELGLGEVTDQINEVKATFTEPLKGVTDIESAGAVAATVTGAGALAGATPTAESSPAAGAFVEGPETPAVTPQTVFADVPRSPAPPEEPVAGAPDETPEAPVAPESPEGAVPAGSPAGPATGA